MLASVANGIFTYEDVEVEAFEAKSRQATENHLKATSRLIEISDEVVDLLEKALENLCVAII